MTKTHLTPYIEKYFTPLVLQHTEKLINDEGNKYRYKQMLREEFSLTGRWDNIISYNARVMADVVALDSVLPLKARPSLEKVTGDIVKIGMKRKLSESEMVNLNALIAMGRPETEVLAHLFKDVPAVVDGVFERLEATFLQALSSGVASITDEHNTGTAVRLDYGYLEANKFKAQGKKWDEAGAKPLSDLRRMLDKADNDGNSIRHIYMDKATFRRFAESEEVRAYASGKIALLAGNKAVYPVPTLKQVNETLQADEDMDFTIHLINRSVTFERDGNPTTYKPWEAGKIIATTEEQVGKLVWADTAEAVSPVAGIKYQKATPWLLVSQWRSNEPLTEMTASQARVVPVICNVERIYQLDSLAVEGAEDSRSDSGVRRGNNL